MAQTKEALRRLLAIAEQQLSAVEGRLLGVLSEEEMRSALDAVAELQIKRDELRTLLRDSWQEDT
jgi:hypothetical protein